MNESVETGTTKTQIPARLDRLPWSRFHWIVIIGLGTAWILDGLENIAKPLTVEDSPNVAAVPAPAG
jgi:hypothetical protein